MARQDTYPEITDPQDGDFLTGVDISDTTQSPQGSTKRLLLSRVASYVLTKLGATVVNTGTANQFGGAAADTVIQEGDRLLIENAPSFAKRHVTGLSMAIPDGTKEQRVRKGDRALVKPSGLTETQSSTFSSANTTPASRTMVIAAFESVNSEEGLIDIRAGSTADGDDFFRFDRFGFWPMHEGTDVENGTPFIMKMPDGQKTIALFAWRLVDADSMEIRILFSQEFVNQNPTVHMTIRPYTEGIKSVVQTSVTHPGTPATVTVVGTGNDEMNPANFASSYVDVLNHYALVLAQGQGIFVRPDGRFEARRRMLVKIDGYADVSHTVNNTHIAVAFTLLRSGVRNLSPRAVHAKIPANDRIGNLTGTGLLQLEPGDIVGVAVAAENSGDVRVYSSSLVITEQS